MGRSAGVSPQAPDNEAGSGGAGPDVPVTSGGNEAAGPDTVGSVPRSPFAR